MGNAAGAHAVVFSGGGFAGGAWMLGLVAGLRSGGLDLGEADLVVGTSAGARIATVVATDSVDDVADLYRRRALPPVEVPAKLEDFVAVSTSIIAAAPTRADAATRIANLPPLGTRLVPEEQRDAFVGAHVRTTEWPEPLVVVAVDADTGQRVTFDRASGVPIASALAASGALPGMFRPVTVGGRRCVDGGVHSLFNVDVAGGYDTVTIVSPLELNDFLARQLDAEAAMLEGANVRRIVADEASLAAIGSDAMSVAAAPAALAAGAAQAARELAAL